MSENEKIDVIEDLRGALPAARETSAKQHELEDKTGLAVVRVARLEHLRAIRDALALSRMLIAFDPEIAAIGIPLEEAIDTFLEKLINDG